MDINGSLGLCFHCLVDNKGSNSATVLVEGTGVCEMHARQVVDATWPQLHKVADIVATKSQKAP
jgi:hypothetical protein